MSRPVLFKFALAGFFIGALALAHTLGLEDVLSLSAIQSKRTALEAFVQARPFLSGGLYALAYTTITALSLPGAAVMTILAGALFPFGLALVLVSFSSSIGATLAFLSARMIFGDAVRARYGEKLRAVEAGVREEGAFYLFALRLVPAFPFFLVNLAMALTPMRTRSFYLVSQIGMLPGTAAYVFAGQQLGEIKALSDVLSPPLIAAFAAVGLLPLGLRLFLNSLRRHRHRHRRPPHGQI